MLKGHTSDFVMKQFSFDLVGANSIYDFLVFTNVIFDFLVLTISLMLPGVLL